MNDAGPVGASSKRLQRKPRRCSRPGKCGILIDADVVASFVTETEATRRLPRRRATAFLMGVGRKPWQLAMGWKPRHPVSTKKAGGRRRVRPGNGQGLYGSCQARKAANVPPGTRKSSTPTLNTRRQLPSPRLTLDATTWLTTRPTVKLVPDTVASCCSLPVPGYRHCRGTQQLRWRLPDQGLIRFGEWRSVYDFVK